MDDERNLELSGSTAFLLCLCASCCEHLCWYGVRYVGSPLERYDIFGVICPYVQDLVHISDKNSIICIQQRR